MTLAGGGKKFILGYAEIHDNLPNMTIYLTLPGVDVVTCIKTMISSHAYVVNNRITK